MVPPSYTILTKLLKLYRFIGMCFVEGLADNDVSRLRPARLTWYIAYPTLTIVVVYVSSIKMIHDLLTRKELNSNVFCIMIGTFLLQAMLNLVSVAAYSPRTVRLIQQCAALETKRPLPERFQRKSRRLFAVAVVASVADVLLHNMDRYVMIADSNDVPTIASVAAFTVSGMMAVWWSIFYDLFFIFVFHLLTGHLEEAVARLGRVPSRKGVGLVACRGRRFCEFRRDLTLLRETLATVNQTLGFGIAVSYGCIIQYVCTASYYTLEPSLLPTTRLATAVFFICTASRITYAAFTAEGLAKQADKARKIVNSFLGPRQSSSESLGTNWPTKFQTFLLSFDVNDFRFHALGLFQVKPSLLPVMAGAAVTYVVVLVQTRITIETDHGCSDTE